MTSVDEEAVVEGKLKSLPGVVDVRASHVAKNIVVVFNPLTTTVERIKESIESIG